MIGLTPHSPLQPAKTKLGKILKRRNFVTVRPRRFINLSDEEDVEADEDLSPMPPKATKKPRVSKPRKLTLWEVEIGSDEALIKINNSPAKSHSPLSKSKNIQRKTLPKKIKKPEKENTIQEQLHLTSFWDSITEFSENPTATISTKHVQETKKKSVPSKQPRLLDSSSCESDEDGFFNSMKKERFFFSPC